MSITIHRQRRVLAAAVVVLTLVAGTASLSRFAAAQDDDAAAPAQPARNGWRKAAGGAARSQSPDAAETERATPPAESTASRSLTSTSIARVTSGNGTLPQDHGQLWREYDISPYTMRITTTKRPEQAIVDWILRETGYEAWHSDTVTVLNANRNSLRVYHTAEVQKSVADIVDRFVNPAAQAHAFGLRVVTIGNPNWRETALRILRPIPVQSQGVQAWLLNKEDAAMLLAQLSKRNDFREYTSQQTGVYNAQTLPLAAARPRPYAKGIVFRPGTPLGFEIETGQVDEGYSLEFSPLLSLDGATIDAVVKCQITQVEKMIPVLIDVPTPAQAQRQKIDVPQITSSDLHERFRWPVDQVLLVSRGVVATPVPKAAGGIGLSLPGSPAPNRADALLFIQSRGRIDPRGDAPPPAAIGAGLRPATRF
jgi:hypothetical protein